MNTGWGNPESDIITRTSPFVLVWLPELETFHSNKSTKIHFVAKGNKNVSYLPVKLSASFTVQIT